MKLDAELSLSGVDARYYYELVGELACMIKSADPELEIWNSMTGEQQDTLIYSYNHSLDLRKKKEELIEAGCKWRAGPQKKVCRCVVCINKFSELNQPLTFEAYLMKSFVEAIAKRFL